MFRGRAQRPRKLATESCRKQYMQQQHNLKKMQAVLFSACGSQSGRALVERIADDKQLGISSSLINKSVAIAASAIFLLFIGFTVWPTKHQGTNWR